MHPDKQAFLAALAEDPYSRSTHMVYSDWLDENGFPDEAAWERAWTKERQEAEDWLRDYARRINRNDAYGYKPGDPFYEEAESTPVLTYEELLAAAYEYLDQREAGEEYPGGFCLNFDTPDVVYENREEFWKHFRTVTGRDAGEYSDRTIFRCSC